jgi:hypothetical protein
MVGEFGASNVHIAENGRIAASLATLLLAQWSNTVGQMTPDAGMISYFLLHEDARQPATR